MKTSPVLMAVLLLSSAGLLQPAGAGPRIAVDPTSVRWDFDGDGRGDVIAVQRQGPNTGLIQIMRGDTASRFAGSTFPAIAAGDFDVIGAGNLLGQMDGRAAIVADRGSCCALALARVFELDAGASSTLQSHFVALDAASRVVGIADADGNASDDLFEVRFAEPNAGLLRVRTLGPDGRSFGPTLFPLLLGPDEWRLEGLGNYDAENGSDVLARRIEPERRGQMRLWTFEGDGQTVLTTGFPRQLDPGWEIVRDRFEQLP